MRQLHVAGVCALGLLLFFSGASTFPEIALADDMTGPVYLKIIVPDPVYADEPFLVTLNVTRDSGVYDRAYGRLYNETGQIGNEFVIRFLDDIWLGTAEITLRGAGVHTLALWVSYLYDTGSEGTDHVETSVVAQTHLPSYRVEWLQYPDEPVRAGKLVRLRFSILDASGSFVQSNDVRIVVENTNVEATCGRKSGSIRINTDKEYYRWYWKTESDLPGGVCSVVVLLNGAELSPPAFITIVSKI